jgi:hypothetical protein
MFYFISYLHLGSAAAGPKGEPGLPGRDGKKIQRKKIF